MLTRSLAFLLSALVLTGGAPRVRVDGKWQIAKRVTLTLYRDGTFTHDDPSKHYHANGRYVFSSGTRLAFSFTMLNGHGVKARTMDVTFEVRPKGNGLLARTGGRGTPYTLWTRKGSVRH
jgi:hypothetical protein